MRMAAVRELVENEADRQEMSHRAREYAVRHLRVEQIVTHYLTLFRETVERCLAETGLRVDCSACRTAVQSSSA